MCPVSSLASLAPILPAHPHLSHWDRDPEALANSTLTAVIPNSVPRNGAAWRSAHWAKNLRIPEHCSWLPSGCLQALQGPNLQAGWLLQWSQEQEPLFRKIVYRLAEIQR